jgi:hypothetical protein
MSEQPNNAFEVLLRDVCAIGAAEFVVRGWIVPRLMMFVKEETILVDLPPEPLHSPEGKQALYSVMRQLVAEAGATCAIFVCESECELPDGAKLEFAMALAQFRHLPEFGLACLQPVRREGDGVVLDGDATVGPSALGRMRLFDPQINETGEKSQAA